jgi:hypothetical protein
MKPADRQKMCPNCDGRIPYDATQCPYCFTAVQGEGNSLKNSSLQDSLTSLYTPPYAAKAEPEEKKRAVEDAAVLPKDAITEEKEAFWPMLLMSLGANLFVLGLLQFFFSENGQVRLEINSEFWFLFILLAIPLFYLGYKKTTN